MLSSLIVLAIVLVPAILILFWIIGAYNSLIVLRNQVKNAWAQIDVQLKRRHDLIPNLVDTVKGYMAHEAGTLEKVVKARQMVINLGDENIKQRAEEENVLSGALKSLFALSEAYPDLKANQNYMQLQEELASTENKIGFARQFYNDAVLAYNNKKEMFPTNIIAGMFNFETKEFFEANAAEKEVPQVKF